MYLRWISIHISFSFNAFGNYDIKDNDTIYCVKAEYEIQDKFLISVLN